MAFAKSIAIAILLSILILPSSYSQEVKVEMIHTKQVESTSPLKEVLVQKYGSDEAKIAEARKKVKAVQATGKRVMTSAEFKAWKKGMETKFKSCKNESEELKMRAYITKKESKIIILEEIL